MVKELTSEIKKLPASAQKIVIQYTNLRIGNKTLVTPYFMNENGKKDRRVFIGKGTSQEIKQATEKLALQNKFDVYQASEEQIKNFMIAYELGIDCSGFIAWTLNEITKERLHKPIWEVLQFSMLPLTGQFKRYLRPVENISVKVLTHPLNSHTIKDLRQIQAGDMIRVLNGHHILLISEIEYDKEHTPIRFKYINSTEYKNKKYGIREGIVEIKDINKYLIEQKWIDEEQGVNWIYNAVKNFKNDSRIVRLKALNIN